MDGINTVSLRLMGKRPIDGKVAIVLRLIDALTPIQQAQLADRLPDRIVDSVLECADQGAAFYDGADQLPAVIDDELLAQIRAAASDNSSHA